MKAFEMGTGVQQIWILRQYGLLMLGKISLQIFLQSEHHTAFITACSAGPRAPISVVKGYEWREAVLHSRGLKSNEARGATARNQPKGRHLLSFPLTVHSMKPYTHTTIRTQILLLHPKIQAVKRRQLVSRQLTHLKACSRKSDVQIRRRTGINQGKKARW